MKTSLAIRWLAAGGRLPVLSGLAVLMTGFAGLPSAAAAGDWALRFNGSTQYAEAPLGETVVLENRGPQFFATNVWWTNSYETNNLSTAKWTPWLPRAGTYKVCARWGGAETPGTNTQCVVKHAAGLFTNGVAMSANPGDWIELGTFGFKADRSEFVELRRGGSGAAPAPAEAVVFVNEQAFDLRQAVTLEAWVKLAGPSNAWAPLLAKGNAWGLLCYNNPLNSSNYLCFRTRDAVTGLDHDLVSDQPLETNRWRHVAATYDGVRKVLYIDGAVAAAATWGAVMATNSYPVRMGANAEEPGGIPFQGELENVRIWSLARTASDLQSYATNRLRGAEAGLLGDWRFDDDAATDFLTLDSATGAMHASLRESNSPPTKVSGLAFGPPLPGPLALQFNGHDQSVSLPAVADGRFDFTNAGTIEAWAYFDFTPAAPAALMSKGANGWDLGLNESGKIVFRTEGVTPAELVSKSRLAPGAWHHLAAVWDGAAGRKDLYVDGLLDATLAGLQGQIPATAHSVHFAARPRAGGREAFFSGTLDEVRLWSVARPGQRIADNFKRRVNSAEPGLAGVWDFDEGRGATALDRGTGATPAPGTMAEGMSDLNRVGGQVLGPALLLQYCLDFNGTNAFVNIGWSNVLGLTNLTIEAWVKPVGTNDRTILMKGADGFGLAIDGSNYLRYFSDGSMTNWLRSTRPLELERDAQGQSVPAWNHVGVVVDRAANTTTFYINGQPAGAHGSSVIPDYTNALVLGKQGGSADTNYFQGQMDEVRLWNIARTRVEMDLFAFTPLLGAAPPGLIGYWTFNEGTGASAADHSGASRDGRLVNMNPGSWRDGTDWGLPALPGGLLGLAPNPSAAGLWIGQVELQKVNEVQQAAQGLATNTTATADAASIRLLLHVAADGQARLLKDVILMRRPADTNGPATNLVLVTRPELIPDFQGVTQRGGKLVGLRYGTVAYDFDGTELRLLGGVGPSAACLGRVTLSKDHPNNPYRHKFHPDHASGFAIVRQITLQFDGAPGDPWLHAPGYGVDRLTGVYRETVVGLHKIPLQVEGVVRLDRINTVGSLNDGR